MNLNVSKNFFCNFKQNIFMSWQNSLYFLIPATFILLLIFPVFVEARVSYNPLYNRGVVALFIFKIKLFYFIFSFHGQFIELENEKETKREKLEFQSQKFAVMEEFSKQIKSKVRLKKLYVFYNIGTGEASSSAMLCGFLNLILTQVFLIIKSKKPTASMCIYDTVSYNKTVFEIAGRMSISISVFDVVYSFILSVILTKRNNLRN